MLPPVIRIEPASSCNLRCLHCPTGLGASPSGIMSQEIFEKIIPSIQANHNLINTVVFYHGGEPLLNKKLPEFIETIKLIGIKNTKLVTNGKLLDDNWIRSLIESNINLIEVSLDGLSGDDSDQIRRRSESESVMNNVKKLFQYSKIHKENGGGQVEIQIATTQFIEDYYSNFDSIGPAPIPDYLAKAFTAEINVKSTWAIQWPGQYPKDSKVLISEQKPIFKEKPTCSLLNETLTVRSNGDVVVCCYDLTSLHVIGNIKEQSLEAIWNSENYKEFRDSFENQNFKEPCKSCSVVIGKAYLSKRKLLSIVE